MAAAALLGAGLFAAGGLLGRTLADRSVSGSEDSTKNIASILVQLEKCCAREEKLIHVVEEINMNLAALSSRPTQTVDLKPIERSITMNTELTNQSLRKILDVVLTFKGFPTQADFEQLVIQLGDIKKRLGDIVIVVKAECEKGRRVESPQPVGAPSPPPVILIPGLPVPSSCLR